MNIYGITPYNIDNNNVSKSADKSSNQLANYTGPSFTDKISDIAKQAALGIAGGNQAAGLALKRQKEEKSTELFSFSEAEQEQLDESLAKIGKLLQDLQK
jgi:hypothetical protein